MMMFRISFQDTQPARRAAAAVACFALAIISGLAGSLLTTNAILNAHEHPMLHAVGLISLILALPLAILGAHWLDLVDRQKRSDTR